MSKKDERLAAMKNALEKYLTGNWGLAELIRVLELHYQSIGASEQWQRDFRREWGHLEEMYAVALDSDESILDLKDSAVVRDAMRKIGDLLEGVAS